jgi:hypothetical protein
MSDRILRWIELGAVVVGMVVVGLGAYYNLDGRVLVLEQRVTSSESNYKGGIEELNRRLDRIESKLDRVVETQRR